MSPSAEREKRREQYRAAMLAYRKAVLRLEETYGTPDFDEACRVAEEARREFERLREKIGD